MYRNGYNIVTMNTNRIGYTTLGDAVSAEIRAEIGRQARTVKDIATAIGMRRATLSSKLHGHTDFSSDELSIVGNQLGLSASAIVARAEQSLGLHRLKPVSRGGGVPGIALCDTTTPPPTPSDTQGSIDPEKISNHMWTCPECQTIEAAATHLQTQQQTNPAGKLADKE